jgi:hypothetical protein
MSWTQRAWIFLLAVRFGNTVWIRCPYWLVVLQEEWHGKRVCNEHKLPSLTRSDNFYFIYSTIRLPGDGYGPSSRGNMGNGGVLDTIASVPWFVMGLGAIAWEWVSSHVEDLTASLGMQSRRGYRDLPVDEDAQVLRFEDEE